MGTANFDELLEGLVGFAGWGCGVGSLFESFLIKDRAVCPATV